MHRYVAYEPCAIDTTVSYCEMIPQEILSVIDFKLGLIHKMLSEVLRLWNKEPSL